jgi:hypothetical protein
VEHGTAVHPRITLDQKPVFEVRWRQPIVDLPEIFIAIHHDASHGTPPENRFLHQLDAIFLTTAPHPSPNFDAECQKAQCQQILA